MWCRIRNIIRVGKKFDGVNRNFELRKIKDKSWSKALQQKREFDSREYNTEVNKNKNKSNKTSCKRSSKLGWNNKKRKKNQQQ